MWQCWQCVCYYAIRAHERAQGALLVLLHSHDGVICPLQGWPEPRHWAARGPEGGQGISLAGGVMPAGCVTGGGLFLKVERSFYGTQCGNY
nr:MAG TPA: hypothetical protein [Caudoviricetes sp.]